MMKKNIQFVVKYTKHCNLRCAYCYEYNELHKTDKMQFSEIEKLFLNCKDYLNKEASAHVNFIWHGGEPFIVDLKNYKKIQQLQEKIFPENIVVSNGVQTNLTILTEKHIQFLKEENFFNSMGISFDVYGDQRVDIKNRLQTDLVLSNLQNIIKNKISVGAISVLAKNTYPYVREIYKFYDELNIPMRFLPIYRSAFDEQVEEHALSVKEIMNAMQMLLEEWSSSPTAVSVDPLEEYISYAIDFIKKEERRDYFNKEEDEHTFILNMNGDLWGVSETYDEEYKYGNVFNEKLEEIFNSEGRNKALACSKKRSERFCNSCIYYGYCSGSFVSNMTPPEALNSEKEGCMVKLSIDLIIKFFEDKNIDQYILNQNKMPKKFSSISTYTA